MPWVISDGADQTSAGNDTVSAAELDAAMFEMDDDASGTISFNEFYRWWQRKQEREMDAKNCWALTDVEKVDVDKLEDTGLGYDHAEQSPTASLSPSPRDRSGPIFKEEAEIAMAELGISGQPTTGTRPKKKGRKARRMSVVEMAEAELAQDDAAWTVSSAVASGKSDEARLAKVAVKQEKRQARNQRWIRSLNCVLCAKSDRKKAIQNRKKNAKKEESHIDKARTECRKVFDHVDSDGSGLLDIDEVPKLAAALGVQLTPEQHHEALLEMDHDASGEVDFEEFWQWWVKTGGVDETPVTKHEDTVLGKASVKWAQGMHLHSSTVQQQKRSKELKNLASRRGMSVEDMKKVNAGQNKVHSSSVWLKKDAKSGLTMWGRKSSGPVGTLGNWETAIETRPQQWQTMSLWMHESDHDFVE